jgi:hypothetical protein
MCDGSYADLFDSMKDMWQEFKIYILEEYTLGVQHKNPLQEKLFGDIYKKMIDLEIKYGWI